MKHVQRDRVILSTETNDDSDLDSHDDVSKNLTSTFEDVVSTSFDNTQNKNSHSRFREPIHVSKLEEAKVTTRAQLDLAFEMLDIMKQRDLVASPVVYKCLINACGRCGDSDRATQLLSRMHESGIVADGVVYSCLVSAFSNENAWNKVSGSEIPGKFFCIII